MALCTVRFFGRSLGKQTAMNIIAPDHFRGRLPVLYLLHGLSDDYTAWQRWTNLERHLDKRRLIVVMPDGERSFYLNSEHAGAYEDHIVKDVVALVDRMFPTIARRKGRAIAGLSMGGFGAMTLGLKHPGVFAAVSSHSGAFDPGRRLADRPDLKPLAGAFNDPGNNCQALAEAVAARRSRPAVRFDCGTEDFLLEANRAFHAELDACGLNHTYQEYAGAHTWDYWDRHIPETLDFVTQHTAAAP